MKLTFFGAARAVTGSCHCVECGGKKILVDCGLQQGRDEKDNQELDFNAGYIDAVVVTHAHIDHSGRLPLLVKQGFDGNIYCTRLTASGPGPSRWSPCTPWPTPRPPSSASSPASTAPVCRLRTG